MSRPLRPPRRRTLQGQLLAWSLGALLLVWAGFLFAGWRTGMHEADELTDGQLASVAALLLSQPTSDLLPRVAPGPSAAPLPAAQTRQALKAHDYQQSLSVVVWAADGTLLAHSGQAPLPMFSSDEGYADLMLGQPPQAWRSFARWQPDSHERQVVVLVSAAERDELAWDMAAQIAEPGLWLMPVVALVLGFAIRRGLAPLQSLQADLAALDVQHAQGLAEAHPEREFREVVGAINDLVQRYQRALANERALASELAHELRTPLAALVLQARKLRDQTKTPSAADDGSDALAQLERDALKASQVLSQLLTLARADHSALVNTAQAVDLEQLARELLAEMAPAAAASGHELALASTGPWSLPAAHPVLLGLALRNLVQNAMQHSAAGSLVELQLDAQAGWLQVCDGPLPHAAAPAALSPPEPGASALGLGLGLGHRVVAKVAKLHAAQFSAAAPPAGFVSCWRLQF